MMKQAVATSIENRSSAHKPPIEIQHCAYKVLLRTPDRIIICRRFLCDHDSYNT
jgi:hypothetical protein